MQVKRLGLLLGLLALLAVAQPQAEADEVRVAVAANFTAPMQALARHFEQESGHRVLLSYGSTGKLYTQIHNGAPFDLFFSADTERPARLEAEGLAVAGSRFVYARGKLALWSPRAHVVDQNGGVLRRGEFQRLAVANAKTAPYGAAAEQVLKALGLYEPLRRRLVYGENIAQTHQFVATGNAELGFVAFSQVKGSAGGSHWEVPQNLYAPLNQGAVLLQRAVANQAARAFVAFMQSDQARQLIVDFGYAETGVRP